MLGVEPTIHETSRVRDSILGEWTDIGANCSINESAVGDYTYFAGDAQVTYATIGQFCSIASHVRINPGNHPMWRVTQHHMTYRRKMFGFGEEDDADFFQWRRDHHVTIGHDVWIGHGAIVMPGVSVGNGAVIGSHAVVTKDVAPYSIVAGVPARVIRERFPKHVADQLQSIAWWDWTRDQLKERFHEFNHLEEFLGRYGDSN